MIYFLLYLFFEVTISVWVFSKIGGINAFFEILLSAMLGIFALSMLKYIAQQSLMATFEQRALLYSSGQSSIFILFGGILLILPGILSDTIGLLMIIIGLGMYVSKRHLGFVGKNSGKNNKDDDVIDVEIIEHNDNFNSKREE